MSNGTKIEKLREEMPQGQRDEFDSFASHARSDTDVWRWLQNEGFSVSLSAVSLWRQVIAPEGTRAIAIKKAATEYAGIDPFSTLSAIEGSAIQLAQSIREVIDLRGVDELTPSAVGVMKMIPGLMREARGAAADKQKLRFTKDRAMLEVAGAQRLADILMRTFEDTPMEEPVREAVDGGIAQVEAEAEDRF